MATKVRAIVAAILVTSMLVFGAGTGRVLADKVNNPHADVFTLNCPGGPITAVSSAHAVSGQVISPETHRVVLGFTFTLPDGEVITVGHVERSELANRLVYCTEDFPGVGTVTVGVLITPAH